MSKNESTCRIEAADLTDRFIRLVSTYYETSVFERGPKAAEVVCCGHDLAARFEEYGLDSGSVLATVDHVERVQVGASMPSHEAISLAMLASGPPANWSASKISLQQVATRLRVDAQPTAGGIAADREPGESPRKDQATESAPVPRQEAQVDYDQRWDFPGSELPDWVNAVAADVRQWVIGDPNEMARFCRELQRLAEERLAGEFESNTQGRPLVAPTETERFAVLAAIHDRVYYDRPDRINPWRTVADDDLNALKAQIVFKILIDRVDDLTEADRPGIEGILRRIELSLDSAGRKTVGTHDDGKAEPRGMTGAVTCETDWKEVRKSLEGLRDQGEAYTTQSDLATRFGCAPSTINKAINASTKLKAWMAIVKGEPRATGLSDAHLDNVQQSREHDPANTLLDDEVDATMQQLIEEADPEERAKLHSLTPDQRREMARVCQDQERDREPSPLANDGPDRPPAQVKMHQRV